MAENLDHIQSEDCNSFLEDELEALSSIYINETNVYKNDETTIVSIDLHPATADNLEEQYVKLTLKLTVEDGYPDVIPEIDIRNPRGLSDEKLSSITKELLKIAEEKRGNSMLFEIIEAAKDYLTAGNRPCEECAICLYGFHEDDVFTKTECYHYFHSSCLARYAKNSSTSDENSKSDDSLTIELLCPVCRLPINFDGVDDSYPSPVKGDDDFSVTETILQTQKKLQELYIKQVEKGGIIDLEAEKNKYLIEISHIPSALDVASEARSEEETSLKMCQDKDISTSPSENIKNDKPDTHKFPLNRSSNSERFNRKYTKRYDERRGNDGPRPYHNNDYRNDRYQGNRGGNGYRKDMRGGRNNYERRYDSYNNDHGERYNGGNRNRFNNLRRNNWHENQHKSNQYERPEKYDDRRSQRYERNDKYDERNNERYERSNKHDSSGQRYSSRDQRKKQHDAEDNVEENASHEIDQKSDSDENNIQDGQMDKGNDEKKNATYDGDQRNVSHHEVRRNNHYDGRRENNYDRRNNRYDYNRRYGRYEDSRAGQYDRRNNRFDNRKYNEQNGSRRNENFSSGRYDRANEVSKNRYLNQENDDKELKPRKENEVSTKNNTTNEKEVESSSSPQEAEQEMNLIDSKDTETDVNSTNLTRDEDVGNASENYPLDRKRNFPMRNSDAHRQNGSRNYNRHYQRSNSNGEKYNNTNRYSKQSNYHSERRQFKPQDIRRNSDDLDGDETTDPSNSRDIAKDAGESNRGNLEHNQEVNDEESGDFSNDQHSRKNSSRMDAGNINHYRNYRDGKQRNNRFPNKNYHETRPYKNDPRSRNYQNDYSDRTSNGSKRFVPEKSTNESRDNIPLTENDTDVKSETVPKESEPVPAKASSKKPTQVQPKDSELEKSVPTSNFLPPMSSVAPPPGFQNPTRKIVYGLAAANPPPGFNRS